MCILERQQALQGFQLAFDIGQAIGQFGLGPLGGVQLLLGLIQGIAQAAVGTTGGGQTVITAVGGGPGDQPQGIFLTGLGGCLAGHTALPGIQLTLDRFAAALAILPGLILVADLGNGLGLTALCGLFGGRQGQGLTGLERVDVIADEGVGVQVLNRQHGLMHAAALRAGFQGDAPEGVRTSGTPLAITGRWRTRGTAAGCRCNSRGRSTGRSGRCRAHNRGTGGGWRGYGSAEGDRGRVIQRRVQQQGELPQHPPGRPAHFHQEVQVGFLDRTVRGDLDIGLAIGLDHRGKGQIGEKEGAVDTGSAEIIRRSQYRTDFRTAQVAHLQQFNLGLKRLIQRRPQVDFPYPKRLNHIG